MRYRQIVSVATQAVPFLLPFLFFLPAFLPGLFARFSRGRRLSRGRKMALSGF